MESRCNEPLQIINQTKVARIRLTFILYSKGLSRIVNFRQMEVVWGVSVASPEVLVVASEATSSESEATSFESKATSSESEATSSYGDYHSL